MGEWKFINVTCLEESELPITANIRRGEGRALNLEKLDNQKEETSTVPLAAALTVIVVLLCAVVVLGGLLILRRRMLSGPGSLSPLVRPSSKQPPPLVNTICRNQYPTYEDNGNLGVGVQNNYSQRTETLSGPALLQQNLLASLQHGSAIETFDSSRDSSTSDQFDDHDYAGLGDCEPPYERVRSRSEHSYETIRKKSLAPSVDMESNEESVSHDPGYETVPGDKESVGYESVKNGRDPGYETVNNKNHEYETLKEKDPGYETVKESIDPGYETVKEAPKTKSPHGYETLRPKHISTITLVENEVEDDGSDPMPDILQNLASDGISSGGSLSDVPLEVQALYAKVDKSKKKNKKKHDLRKLERRSLSPGKNEENCPSTDVSIISENSANDNSKAVTRDLIKKFNKMSNDDEKVSKKSEFEVTNTNGTLRPLPPLPNSK